MKTKARQSKRMGRPTIYSEDLANKICDRIAFGRSLRSVCEDSDIPNKMTVLRWLRDKPDFRAQYEISRKELIELEADRLLEIADNSDEDPQRSRLMVDARKWLLSKLVPKKYGDRIELEQSGELDLVITIGGDKPNTGDC
jgi:outer membrane lipoprotein-sorting protein